MYSNGLVARSTGVFVGRLPELHTLNAALAAARAGEPRVVLIEGDAGVGKSSLVLQFLGSQPGVAAVAVGCDEAEAFLPYGVVQQLAATTTALAANALAGLKLLYQGPSANADAVAVGVELLALISSLQGRDVVALVIEDLQWIDLASARAVLFACRRFGADRVLVVLTCRPGGMSHLGEGWDRFLTGDLRSVRLMLGGLTAGEVGMLCRELGRLGLSEQACERVTDITGGNPLFVRTMLEDISDEALNGPDPLLHARGSSAEMIAPRLAALAPAVTDFVAALSVLGDHSSIADIAALAGTAAPSAALGAAEHAGFLVERQTPTGWRVSFSHLLVRQAVYASLGADRRRALHLRAAAIVEGDEALAHRAAAAVGPDQELAADLDEAADKAVVAGKLRLAARYLQQAAEVTRSGSKRHHRILSSFELLVRAADVAQAEAVRPMVERLPARARRDAALGQLALLAARPLEAQSMLRAAWDAHDPRTESSTGGEAALGLGTLLGVSGSFAESSIWLDRALSSATGSESWYDGARCMRAISFTLCGEGGKALNLFCDLPERPAMVPMANTDCLTYRGLVKLWTGGLQGAIDDLSTAADRIRSGFPGRFPSQPLAFLAEAEFRRGRWDNCQDHAELAVSLARDTDRQSDMPFVHSAAARVPACRGDWELAGRHVEAGEDAARAFGGFAEIFAGSARSILGFARNDPGEALQGAATALAVSEIDYYDDPGAFWWRPLQIWALIRHGQLRDAEAILEAFESRAAERRESLALINAAWLRGLLATSQGELEPAEQMLGNGCNAPGIGVFPFHRALLHLEHGRCLAQLRHRKAAIAALRGAEELFTALTARPFMQAARSELTALGVRLRGGGDPDLPGLTAQELRVARLVASGVSNREAASQLYLSPKTVEYHLASVFAKLGIASRQQLAVRVRGRKGPA